MDIVPEYGPRASRRLRKLRADEDRGRQRQRHPGELGPGILRALGCEVIELASGSRRRLPNHHPDPSKPENLADLIRSGEGHRRRTGLAFDGDGDRLGVVTVDGHVIYPDRQMMLFAQDILSAQPGRAP